MTKNDPVTMNKYDETNTPRELIDITISVGRGSFTLFDFERDILLKDGVLLLSGCWESTERQRCSSVSVRGDPHILADIRADNSTQSVITICNVRCL